MSVGREQSRAIPTRLTAYQPNAMNISADGALRVVSSPRVGALDAGTSRHLQLPAPSSL
jgi:hypothetical protein